MRMSLSDASSDFDEKLYDFSSSECSDLESFFEEDKTDNGNGINEEWEAIERTLYEESGEKVTEPQMLRECKLWRETFPHFRVKGTKIQAKEPDDDDKETEKSIQTQGNHLNLDKVNERRENIKNKVVDQLVERLISKFSLIKNSNAPPPEFEEKGLPVPENFPDKLNTVIEKKTLSSRAENESYFERGKLINAVENPGISEEDMEERFERIFERGDEPATSRKSPTKSREIPHKNCNLFKMPNTCKSEHFGSRPTEKAGGRHKPAKFCTSLDSLSSGIKPFEMTKKIHRKYEGLLGKIMEERIGELQPLADCQTTLHGESKGYPASLEELRIGAMFDKFSKRNQNLARINKFSNSWLERGELNSYYPKKVGFPLQQSDRARTKLMPSGDVSLYSSNGYEINEKLMEEFRREMTWKRPPKKSGVLEEISLRTTKPLRPDLVGRSQKSLNCGDLAKKNKKVSKNMSKSSLESGSNLKSRAKSINSNFSKGISGPKNGILPPIESGIICTELKGRPKIGARKPMKRP